MPGGGVVWHTPHPSWKWSRVFLRDWILRNRWELIAVILLTAIAAFLRTYRLEEIPAGFHGDEAWTGIEGLRILREGWIGPYTPSALGQATGPFYLTALLIWLLDASRFTVRLSMALFGIATVPATYLLMRLAFGRWIALFSTAALTVSYWHLHYSRLGFGLISLAFVATVTAASLLWAMRQRSRWSWLAAGACLGLAPYTYFAFPSLLATIAVVLAAYFWLERATLRNRVIRLTWFAVGALIVASPVLSLAIESPGIYFNRMLMVSADRYSESLSAESGARFLGKRAWEALTLFLKNPRHDGADGTGGPGVLDLGMAILAYLGLAASIRKWRSPPHLFAVVALLFALLSILFTDPSSGTMRRTIIAIPWVFGLAGVGAVVIVDFIRRHQGEAWRYVSAACLAIVLLMGGIWNLNYYFVDLPASPTFRWTFSTKYFEALDAAHSFDDPGTIYYFSDQKSFGYETIRFLYPDSSGIDRSQEFGEFDLEKLDPGPVTYLLEGPYMEEIDIIMEMYPGGELIVDKGSHPLYIVYHLRG
ncbi:MAG: glycosyltransferase family 39 protein [Caldilineaceae bacterium]|nr:glycosyltransferase family 39 protein [Caldilineaceae bacterium]